MQDNDVWFEPKHEGHGAGIPVAWQGWALIASWAGGLAALAALLPPPRHPLSYGISAVAVTAATMSEVARHTRSGWRWRSGGPD